MLQCVGFENASTEILSWKYSIESSAASFPLIETDAYLNIVRQGFENELADALSSLFLACGTGNSENKSSHAVSLDHQPQDEHADDGTLDFIIETNTICV
jgi:hypothetical protein